MKIIYKQGDLFQCSENIILHGCNSQGVMGTGVAKLIREKYPSAYTTYLAGYMELGTVTYAVQDDGKVIMNAVTQEFYGRQKDRVYVSYQAIEDALQRINWWASHSKDKSLVIAMPKIGAGLGGGDWEVIEGIIEKESTHFQPVVYEL